MRKHNIIFLLDAPNPKLLDGDTLRILTYSRWLRKMGHRIYFLVPGWSYHPEVLQVLVDRGDIDGFARLANYRTSGLVNAISRLFIVPGIRNRMLRSQQQQVISGILAEVERRDCDLIILHQRSYLFSIDQLKKSVAVVVDWCDSFALASWRSLKLSLRRWDLTKLTNDLRYLVAYAAEESYYAKRAHSNLVVSPVDKSVIGRLSRAPQLIQVIPNGISFPASAQNCERVPGRLIFTGWMNFPPNYEGALWFLDFVFPLIVKIKPDVQFVIAGADPIPKLRARVDRNVQVTGAVPDLSVEIARSQIYVAPLVSGSGFKNKIFEAIAAGTYVVATSYAAEFLTPELRQCVTVADGATGLASAILGALDNPEPLRKSVQTAQAILRSDYSWEVRSEALERIFDATVAKQRVSAIQHLLSTGQ
jgi:glycosyltransferase involved in cell wall biosynthesis